jgi:hypothetical protein
MGSRHEPLPLHNRRHDIHGDDGMMTDGDPDGVVFWTTTLLGILAWLI